MPRQPNVRSNDPNRRPSGPGSSAFSYLTLGEQEGVAQYSQEDPGLVRNDTQADVLKVGKTVGGPVGTPLGTSLAKLLNAGISAAETGARVYATHKANMDRQSKKEDEQVRLEYEQEKLDLMNTDEWPDMNAEEQAKEMRALHQRYKDRYKREENKLEWNKTETRFRLEAPHIEADTWYSETVTKGIQEIKLLRLSEEEEANAISELVKEATDFVSQKWGEDSPLADRMRGILLADEEKADNAATNAARQLVSDYRDLITDAMNGMMEMEAQGIDPVPDFTGDEKDRTQYYVDTILEKAGIDLYSLDPGSLGHVQREARRLLEPVLKVNARNVELQEKKQVGAKIQQNFERNLVDLGNPEIDIWRDNAWYGPALDSIEQHKRNGTRPEELLRKDVERIGEAWINRAVDDPRLLGTGEERRSMAKNQMGILLVKAGYSPDSEFYKTQMAKFNRSVDEKQWNIFERSIETYNDQNLIILAKNGTNPTERDLAANAVSERMHNEAADLVGHNMAAGIAKARIDRQAGPGFFAQYGPKGAINRLIDEGIEANSLAVQDAMKIATIRAGRGNVSFQDALREELETREGLSVGMLPRIMELTKNHAGINDLLIVDEMYRNGEIDNIERTQRLEKWYADNGGQFSGKDDPNPGNMEGGLIRLTEAQKRQAILIDSDSSASAGYEIGRSMESVPDAESGRVGAHARQFVDNIRKQFGPDFPLSGLRPSEKKQRVKDMFEEVYGTAPDDIGLDRIVDYIENGAEDEDTIRGLDTTFDAFQREHLMGYVEADTEASLGRYTRTNLQQIDPFMQLQMSEAAKGKPLSPEDIASFGAKRGLSITQDNNGNFIVTPDPTKGTGEGRVLYFPSDVDGDRSAMQVSQHIGVVSTEYQDWASDVRGNLNEDSKLTFGALDHIMKVAIEGESEDRRKMHDLLSLKSGLTLPGMTRDQSRKFMQAVKDPNTMSISAARMAIAADLIKRGVPIEDDQWNRQFIDKAAKGWTRNLDGSATIMLNEGKEVGYEVPSWLGYHNSNGPAGYRSATRKLTKKGMEYARVGKLHLLREDEKYEN